MVPPLMTQLLTFSEIDLRPCFVKSENNGPIDKKFTNMLILLVF